MMPPVLQVATLCKHIVAQDCVSQGSVIMVPFLWPLVSSPSRLHGLRVERWPHRPADTRSCDGTPPTPETQTIPHPTLGTTCRLLLPCINQQHLVARVGIKRIAAYSASQPIASEWSTGFKRTLNAMVVSLDSLMDSTPCVIDEG